jgi:hypothetical protein
MNSPYAVADFAVKTVHLDDIELTSPVIALF